MGGEQFCSFLNIGGGQCLKERVCSSGSSLFLFREGRVWMDGWMDDLRFYVLFNSISVVTTDNSTLRIAYGFLSNL